MWSQATHALETPGATAEPCVAGADDGTTLLAACGVGPTTHVKGG